MARIAFRRQYGKYPTVLRVNPSVFEKIQSGLYEGRCTNAKDIPLARYDQMEIIVIDGHDGWSIE